MFDRPSIGLLEHERDVHRIAAGRHVDPLRAAGGVAGQSHRGLAAGGSEQQERRVDVHRPGRDGHDRFVFLAAFRAGDQFEEAIVEADGRLEVDAPLREIHGQARQDHRRSVRLRRVGGGRGLVAGRLVVESHFAHADRLREADPHPIALRAVKPQHVPPRRVGLGAFGHGAPAIGLAHLHDEGNRAIVFEGEVERVCR